MLGAIGVPAKWMRDDEEIAEIEEQHRQQKMAQQALGDVAQGAAATKDLGSAAKSFADAQAAGV